MCASTSPESLSFESIRAWILENNVNRCVMTRRELAKLLGKSERSIHNYVKRRDLDKVGRSTFTVDGVARFLLYNPGGCLFPKLFCYTPLCKLKISPKNTRITFLRLSPSVYRRKRCPADFVLL